MKDILTMTPDEAAAEAHRRLHRRTLGMPLHPTPDEVAAEAAKREKEDDDRLERDIQAECYKRYRAAGCDVYWLSQARATKQTPGIADLLIFPPGPLGGSFWHEVKTPTGKQRPDQIVFQEHCVRTRTTYVLGGVAAANEQIRKLGLQVLE